MELPPLPATPSRPDDADKALTGKPEPKPEPKTEPTPAPAPAKPRETAPPLLETGKDKPETKPGAPAPAKEPEPAPPPVEKGKWAVQVVSVRDGKAAGDVKAKIEADFGYEAELVRTGGWTKVLAGFFPDEATARKAQARLRTVYSDCFVKER